MIRRIWWVVFAVMLVGGLISRGVSAEFPVAAPLFLVMAGGLTLYEHPGAWKGLAGAALLGVAFEWIGVRTGFPFGRYAYTPTLGFGVWGVPFAIGFAWLILIDFVRGVTGSVLGGALLMAAVDLTIDPLAAGPLRYWQWFDHGAYFGIPAVNFVGWYAVSSVILTVVPKSKRQVSYVGCCVVAFFAVIAFELGLWVPGLVGVGVLGIAAFTAREQLAELLQAWRYRRR